MWGLCVCVCVCVCVEEWVGDTKCIKQMIDDFHSYTWWRSLCSLSAFLCSHPIQLFSSLSLQSIPSPLPLSPSSFPALRIIFLCLICFCLHLNPSLPFNLLPSSDFTCMRGVAWRLVPPPPPLLTHWSFCHLQFEDYFRHLWSDRHYIAEIEKTASETCVKSLYLNWQCLHNFVLKKVWISTATQIQPCTHSLNGLT